MRVVCGSEEVGAHCKPDEGRYSGWCLGGGSRGGDCINDGGEARRGGNECTDDKDKVGRGGDQRRGSA